MNVKPKTYNEILLYCRCNELKKQIPNIEESVLEKVFSFLCADLEHNILIHDKEIEFRKEDVILSKVVLDSWISNRIENIILDKSHYSVEYKYTSSGGGYYSGGDGGSSGNNNNNNNNNNNG